MIICTFRMSFKLQGLRYMYPPRFSHILSWFKTAQNEYHSRWWSCESSTGYHIVKTLYFSRPFLFFFYFAMQLIEERQLKRRDLKRWRRGGGEETNKQTETSCELSGTVFVSHILWACPLMGSPNQLSLVWASGLRPRAKCGGVEIRQSCLLIGDKELHH